MSCATPGACHGPDPTQNLNKVLNGANNTTKIQNAINGGVASMTFLQGKFSAQEMLDIAAYLANPNVTAAPTLSVTTTALSYGSVSVGATKPLTVTVTNTGSANLTVNTPSIGGTNAVDFIVSGNTCTAAVAPSATCTVTVTFQPSAASARSASLGITSNGGNATVSLSGTGSGQPTASMNAPVGGLIFPDTVVGGAASAPTNLDPITLSNTGSAPLTISSISASTNFTLDSTPAAACKINTPVAAGGSCTISTRFQPSTAGAKTGTMSVAHNAAGSPTIVALSGTALATPKPVAGLSATTLDFGNVALGTTSAAQTVTLTNGGGKALSISGIADTSGAEFARSGTCAAGQVAAGATCTIVVAFSPAAAGARSGTITLTDDAGDILGTTQNITLTGTGKATLMPPAPSFTPTQLDFSSQEVNRASPTLTITLTNSSTTDPINIADISVGGSNAAEFVIDPAVANACVAAGTLAVGASCDVGVIFTPVGSGNRVASLSIATDATGSPHAIALSGTGSSPVVALAAAPSSNVGGGGCAIAANATKDPTLPLLLSLAFGALLARPARRR